MSKVETVEPVKISKTYEVYNDNLELVKKTVEVEFVPATSYEEAVSRLGNDVNKMLDGLNSIIRRETLSEARKTAGVSGGINREVLMNFIKPYRDLPVFAKMISAEDKRKASAEEWNAQTNAILEQIKNVPFVIDSIKQLSSKANETEE